MQTASMRVWINLREKTIYGPSCDHDDYFSFLTSVFFVLFFVIHEFTIFTIYRYSLHAQKEKKWCNFHQFHHQLSLFI